MKPSADSSKQTNKAAVTGGYTHDQNHHILREPLHQDTPVAELIPIHRKRQPKFKMAAAAVQVPRQPDITYAPNYDNYISRIKRRQENEKLEKSLPEGFPAKLESDLVWDGRNLGETYDWNYVLTESNIAEIDQALRHFKSLNLGLGHITQETFPLPKLHDTLREISKEVHLGHGFKVVKGVPVDNYSREENVIIYAGLSSHVAPIRGRQDYQFDGKPADVVLAHIKDLSQEIDPHKIGAPAYTADKQVFHTDVGDVIALFALGEPEEGGQSFLSSSWHVYNELAATRPDLIRTLAEPWAVDEFGKRGRTHSLRPLLYFQPATEDTPQRLIIQYARRTFTGYWGLPRSNDIPPITEAQAEALDALHFTAEKYRAALDFHKGDIQFANNLSIFHAREKFRDSQEKRRHLIRLWLRDPELAWKTPGPLSDNWDRVYKDVKPDNSVFPLEPRVRSASDGNPTENKYE